MTGIEILLLVIGVVFFVASFFITEKLTPGELNKIGELSNEEIQKVMERELEKVSAEIEGKVEEKLEEKLDDASVQAERAMEKESNEKIMAISEYSDTIMESMNKTHNEIMFLYSMLNDKHTELTEFSGKLQELASRLEKQDEEIVSHMAKRAQAQQTVQSSFPQTQAVKPSVPKQQVRPQTAQAKPQQAEQKPTVQKQSAPSAAAAQVKPLQVQTEEADDSFFVKWEAEPALKEMQEAVEWETDELTEQDKKVETEIEEKNNHNGAILALHKEGKTAIEIARELSLGLGEVQLVIGLYEGNRKK